MPGNSQRPVAWIASAIDSTDAIRLVAGAHPVATGSTAQFLFETGSGRLWFDPDGAGARDPELALILTGVSTLTTSDFVLH